MTPRKHVTFHLGSVPYLSHRVSIVRVSGPVSLDRTLSRSPVAHTLYNRTTKETSLSRTVGGRTHGIVDGSREPTTVEFGASYGSGSRSTGFYTQTSEGGRFPLIGDCESATSSGVPDCPLLPLILPENHYHEFSTLQLLLRWLLHHNLVRSIKYLRPSGPT